MLVDCKVTGIFNGAQILGSGDYLEGQGGILTIPASRLTTPGIRITKLRAKQSLKDHVRTPVIYVTEVQGLRLKVSYVP